MDIVSFENDVVLESKPFNFGLTLFCYGCNMKCKMCEGYNYETVTNKKNIIGKAIDIIDKNITKHHDVVNFIGGEPTCWGESLLEALEFCKKINVKTKIFTNGFDVDLIKKINELKLCDAWSVDFKMPLFKDFSSPIYKEIEEELGVDGVLYIKNLYSTIDNIICSNIPLEIRTTFYQGNEKYRDKIIKQIELIKIYIKAKSPGIYFEYITQEDHRKFINGGI